jgi:hypothetical protein
MESDIVAIVKAFRAVCQDLDVAPEMPIGAQVQQILEYVDLRRMHTAMDLIPKTPVHYPEDWSNRDEQIWIEWLNDRFSIDVWQKEVIYRALGSHMPFWDDWISDELQGLLPWWVQRSTAIVDEYDATPLAEESLGGSNSYSRVDPYIAEHGTAKQRRDAMAGRH